MPVYITPPPGNGLTRVLAVIIGVLALAAFFFVGLVALVIVVGVGLVLGIVAWVRQRFFAPASPKSTSGQAPGSRSRADVIDAEYSVVSREKGERGDAD
ncbi:hypothetical protein [Marinihelvus fidelis]|uniref:hypothetical protein n=1 Tax=Marinihelvus fidelis TaxID=2613842 RepID=UPI0017873FE9|nr:hypothetical protein [Marinihelvus fidelis]